jgi:glycerol-3-phosphate dehydrogenase
MPPAALRSSERESRIARLEAERFDLVVIGGGITGAAIACEGARRGLRVALLEAGDFAPGTSSRSSKFVHGGLRYLALGDVATVRSTALERKVLHRIAPHLAEPHWVVVPARSWAGLAKLRAALTAYEKLGEVEDAYRHRNWSGEELARGEPILDRSVYPYGCVFREYLTDDARLVLANLRAAAGFGAAVLSRAPMGAILRDGSAACGVEATCAESGGSDGSGARFSVRARCVVNAAGPWVDAVRVLEDPDAAPKLHLSKGVHGVFRRERLPLRKVLLLGTEDRRSIFAVPRGEAVYVGTTDTTWSEGHTAWPRIDPADVSYLLAPPHRQLPAHGLGPLDVFAAWAGLRPLVAEPGKPPTEISRKDEVTIGPAGVVSVAGGKLTGYRPMAQATLEGAAAHAGLALAPHREPEPLPGGEGPRISGRWRAAWWGCLRRWRPVLRGLMAARLPRCSRAGRTCLSRERASWRGKWTGPWTWRMRSAWRTSCTAARARPFTIPSAARRSWRPWPSGWRASSAGATHAGRPRWGAVRERLAEDLGFKNRSTGAADPASGGEERA